MIVAAFAVIAAAAAPCAAIVGATAWLPHGPTPDAVVVFEGSTVVATRADAPDVRVLGGEVSWKGARCRAIDGRGAQLTAGLVEASTQLGVVEISGEEATADADAGGADPIRASLRVADAYDPRATAIAVSRAGGLTAAVVTPTGGLVSGQAAWVDLIGATQAESVVRPAVAVIAHLGVSGSKAQDWSALRELLDRARLYASRGPAWAAELDDRSTSSADLAALQPVIRGEIPLVLAADRAADLEAALRLAAEYRLRLIIVGAAEGWLVADALAASRTPVIVDPLVTGAGSFDDRYGRADNAALLAAAGVPVILSTGQTFNARALRQVAGNAVRAGMPPADALRAITEAPALAFGLPDRGRIAPGARADLVLWTGDPFETSSAARQVWIAGVEAPLDTRQRALLARYRTLPAPASAPPIGR